MSDKDHPDAKELGELLALSYSVDTQSKIAKLLNKGTGNLTYDFASEEHFEGMMMFLSIISGKITGRPMAVSHSIASGILGKICITAISTQSLYRGYEEKRLPFLDHCSIATLCRAIIEMSIMYWYLMEEVSGDEWDFRFQVMKIHDAASRVRLFKPIISDTTDNERVGLQMLRDGLAAMPLFQKRSAQEQR